MAEVGAEARWLGLADGCTCGEPAFRNDDGSQWHFQACRHARVLLPDVSNPSLAPPTTNETSEDT